VRPMVVVVVLPLAQFLVEHVDVVADAILVEEPIELLVVDAMRTLDLAVEPRRTRSDVHVADVELLEVPVKARLELGAVVGLDEVHAKRQPANDFVGEVDGGRLIARVVVQDSDASAVVDGGEL